MANDFQSVLYASAALRAMRCEPEHALATDDFTNASWANTRTTDAANTALDPTGVSTADSIIEDATATNTHYIEQTATVFGIGTELLFFRMPESQYAHLGALALMNRPARRSSRNISIWRRAWLARRRPAPIGSMGAPFSVSLGNGWCAITSSVVRPASAPRSPAGYLATADNTNSYTGDGASSIFAWRGGVNPAGVITTLANCGGSVPFIPAQTTSATLLLVRASGQCPARQGLTL